jgi:hypothetical protein
MAAIKACGRDASVSIMLLLLQRQPVPGKATQRHRLFYQATFQNLSSSTASVSSESILIGL